MMSTWLNFLFLGFLILLYPIKCCMKDGIKVEDEGSASTASTGTTIESSESVKELITEVPNSYKTLMKRLNLKPYTRYIRLNLNEPAKPKILAEMIYHNFVEGHFYGYNAMFSRPASDNLRIEDRFNRKALYHLMGNEEALKLIGFKYCLMIVKEAINIFKVYSGHFNRRKVYEMFESAAIDLVDFMEVILSYLAPKYALARNDPMYDLEAHCIMEYEYLITATSIVDASILDKFNEPDLLKVIVRRYASIWPASMTGKIINDIVDLGNTNLFRDVFSFMVKRVPEYFVHSDQNSRYNTRIKWFRDNICGTMNMMAPIFRALTLIDTDIVIEDYLQRYYNQLIKPPTQDPCFTSNDSSIKALNYFVRDSKFTLINSFKMKERKRGLLEKILLKFYGINEGKVYNLIRYTLSHELLSLYEVLLQHFGEGLSTNHKKELVELLITSKEIENVIIATSISLGYLEIEDFEGFLFDLNPENNRFLLKLPRRNLDKTFKRQMKRFLFVKEIHKLLENCPIKGKNGIFVGEGFEAVPWEYPVNIFEEEEEADDEESESYPKLFYYAQAVLCKYFDISISSVSYFESTMSESVVWSEMIGYMNLMIETQSKVVHGRQNAKLFKFIDSTKYEND